jgi:hypothetical protein
MLCCVIHAFSVVRCHGQLHRFFFCCKLPSVLVPGCTTLMRRSDGVLDGCGASSTFCQYMILRALTPIGTVFVPSGENGKGEASSQSPRCHRNDDATTAEHRQPITAKSTEGQKIQI